MLSLPSKPWKKVKIEVLAASEFRITFLSALDSEAQFLEMLDEDLAPCLGAQDRLRDPDWASRSVTLTTGDLAAFKRKLIYACVMVETA